jgi:hypothetical protein
MKLRIAGRLLHELAGMNELVAKPRVAVRIEYASTQSITWAVRLDFRTSG